MIESETIDIVALADPEGMKEIALWLGQSSVDYYYGQAQLDESGQTFLLQFKLSESEFDIIKELAKDKSTEGSSTILKACLQFASKHGGIAVPKAQQADWKVFKKQHMEAAT